MADLSDVLTALVNRISGIVYPNGTGAASATGYATRIFPGWPVPESIDADMAATPPVVNVSVFPETTERNVTRYGPMPIWFDNVRGVPTITAAVAKQTVTLGGTITAGNYVSIVLFNQGISYKLLNSDTLTTVAAALVTLLVAAGIPATSTAGVISIPSADVTDMVARVGAPGTVFREIRRQQRLIRITTWAPTQAVRDATASLIDNALALIAPPTLASDFLSFPDGSTGWLLYHGTIDIDRFETKSVSCRDLCYWVEYPTIQAGVGYPITIWQTQANALDGSPDGATYVSNY